MSHIYFTEWDGLDFSQLWKSSTGDFTSCCVCNNKYKGESCETSVMTPQLLEVVPILTPKPTPTPVGPEHLSELPDACQRSLPGIHEMAKVCSVSPFSFFFPGILNKKKDV